MSEPEMKLPDGKTCRDCIHHARCVTFGYTKPISTVCDFSPSKFQPRIPGYEGCGHPTNSDTCPRCGP